MTSIINLDHYLITYRNTDCWMIQEDVGELDHLDHAAVARIKNFVKVQVRIHLSTFPVKQIIIKKV